LKKSLVHCSRSDFLSGKVFHCDACEEAYIVILSFNHAEKFKENIGSKLQRNIRAEERMKERR